jgi:hypothetical protein
MIELKVAKKNVFLRRGMAFAVFLLFGAVLFGSCAGVTANIVIRRDGSGTVTLEYRIAQALESLGKLDGNERWLPVPVGKADFERSAARVPGLTVVSFSSKQTVRDTICQVKMNFASLDALASFLDASGQRVTLVRDGGRTGLTLSVGGYGINADTDLLALVPVVTEGYALEFQFSLPAGASCRVLDVLGAAKTAPPAGALQVRGSQVEYAVPLADILASAEPVILEILW